MVACCFVLGFAYLWCLYCCNLFGLRVFVCLLFEFVWLFGVVITVVCGL